MGGQKIYGFLSEDGGEYIVTNPETPLPWVNNLSTPDFLSLVSLTGGGNHAFSLKPTDPLVEDRPGRYIYLRNLDSGELWSPTWQPVRKPLDTFEARIGYGYTRVSSSYQDIDCQVTHTTDKRSELTRLTIANLGKARLSLAVYYYIEIGQATSRFAGNALSFDVDGQIVGYVTCNRQIDSFETDKVAFLGRYGALDKPLALTEGRLNRSLTHRQSTIAVVQKNIILLPKRSTSLIFVSSQTKPTAKIAKIGDEYFDALIASKRDEFEKMAESVQIDTPHRTLNQWFNHFGKRELFAIKRSGGASYHLNCDSALDQLKNDIYSLPYLASKKVFEYLENADPTVNLYTLLGMVSAHMELSQGVNFRSNDTIVVINRLLADLKEKQLSVADQALRVYLLKQLLVIYEEHGHHILAQKLTRDIERLSGEVLKSKAIVGYEALYWLLKSCLLTKERSKKLLKLADKHLDETAMTSEILRTDLLVYRAGCRLMMGLGDEAIKAIDKLLPLGKSQEVYQAEPYLLSQYLSTSLSQQQGRGVGTWVGSQAGLLLRVLSENLLGIEPVDGGLKVDPCLPRDWRNLKASRKFRGAEYHFDIFNPLRQNCGVNRVVVDGKIITGNVIPAFNSGVHFVDVTLG